MPSTGAGFNVLQPVSSNMQNTPVNSASRYGSAFKGGNDNSGGCDSVCGANSGVGNSSNSNVNNNVNSSSAWGHIKGHFTSLLGMAPAGTAGAAGVLGPAPAAPQTPSHCVQTQHVFTPYRSALL
jgi:hypothetical protein